MLEQFVPALGVVVLYGTLCWRCLKSTPDHEPAASAGEILIGYASQSGEAERIAKQQAEFLSSQGPVLALPLNRINERHLSSTSLALFVVSTYGEGEPPDNAVRFTRQWLGPAQAGAACKKASLLAHLRFAVLALGDSSYRFYCGFGRQLAAGLANHGARPLFEPVLVDRMSPEHLQQWREQLATTGIFESSQLAFDSSDALPRYRCTLIHRELLNQGSPGGAMYLLRFDTNRSRFPGGQAPQWQAGDIAIVSLPSEEAVQREYSIASVPADGGLELLVRQVCKDDGSKGLGSGYLTQQLALGTTATISLRSNKSFHAPKPQQPMVLIGNGTGIAGLRAHLRCRELEGGSRNWLLFGERTQCFDQLFDDEIQHWCKYGVISELDRVYSRDNGEFRYVQDVLTAKSETLRQWVDEGAAIYVCGSLQGMATSVHRALLDALGETQLESLILDGRYRRDVY